MKARWALPLILNLVLGACSTSNSTDEDASGSGGSTTNGGHAGGSAGTTGAAGSSGPGSGGTAGGAGVAGSGGTTGEAGSGGAGGGANVAGTTGKGGTAGAAGATGTAGKGGTAGAAGATGTAGKGGTTGAAGTTGTAGTSGSSAICNFASGLNVAWVNFAGDVPNPNLASFNAIFQNTFTAGGRVVRWWLHTNGTVTPGYDSSGKAMALTSAATSGIVSVLNAAHTAGVAIDLSLWSFDMLQGGENISTAVRSNNMNLLTVDANRQAYIDNVLTPMVTALKGNPGLYSYEIFNEPEGMTTQHGWTTANGGTEVDQMYIQKTVNWFAAAIHAADPSALVTSGAQTFDTCSALSGKTNLYSDSALQAAGGKSNGTLDFYEVHYYTSNGTSDSCFMHPASYWGLDKKLVMGEFAAQTTDSINQNDLYTYLYTNGYNGAWAWSYDADYPWPDMQTAMQNVYNAHTSDVNSCP
jgi:hypothetical protein